MYFDRFPKIIYEFPFTNGSVLRQVTDITVNLRPLRNVLENVVYYEDYDIVDGDTPEIIAERVYKNPELHWVIMLINEKYD